MWIHAALTKAESLHILEEVFPNVRNHLCSAVQRTETSMQLQNRHKQYYQFRDDPKLLSCLWQFENYWLPKNST